MSSKMETYPSASISLRVIIVGAGLGGLSTAISLARRGHSVVILESTSKIQPIGAAVGVPPTTKQWFNSEGVLQSDDSLWTSLEGFSVRHWDTGEVIPSTAKLNSAVGKATAIHRGDLQMALYAHAQQLENIEIRLGTRITDVDVEAATVSIASGDPIGGDLVIIADGVNSKLKWKICPSELERAQSTGDAAYRLTVARELMGDDEELLALVREPWVKRWDGPDGHIIAYPVHNYEILNVVLTRPDDGSAEESWTSWTDKSHVVSTFEGWDPVLRKLVALAPTEVPKFKILIHSPLPAWTKGSAVLLGDCCHALPPYLGQGVAQAIEDVAAITAVLSMISSKEQLPLALKAYESSRKRRVEDVHDATFKAKEYIYRKDDDAKAAPTKEEATALEAARSDDVVKMMRSQWEWDAAEAARMALSDILGQV